MYQVHVHNSNPSLSIRKGDYLSPEIAGIEKLRLRSASPSDRDIPANSSSLLAPSPVGHSFLFHPSSHCEAGSHQSLDTTTPPGSLRSVSHSPVSYDHLQRLASLSPFFEKTQIHPYYSASLSKIPLHDPASLKAYLKQVNLTRYGFGLQSLDDESRSRPSSPHLTTATAIKPKPLQSTRVTLSRSPSSLLLSSPMSKGNESEGNLDEDLFVYKSTRIAAMSKTKVPSSPTSFFVPVLPSTSSKNLAVHYPSRSASTSPHSPYKGRHGANPRCASCKTTKTPYWRDSWNQGFILCNACGLRYSKFKRRCTQCNYVPKKEDKGNRCCTQCSGAWTQ